MPDAERFLGVWWLADQPDVRVSGALEIDGEDGRVELELIGALLPLGGDLTGPSLVVCGEANGSKVSLLDCSRASGGSMTIAQVETVTQVFRARVALVGVHIDRPDAAVFAGIRVELSHLTLWTARSGITEVWGGGTNSSVDVEGLDDVAAQFDDGSTAKLQWIRGRSAPDDAWGNRRRVNESVELVLSASEPRAWSGFAEHYRALQDMLTLASRVPCSIGQMTLILSDAPLGHSKVRLFFNKSKSKASDVALRRSDLAFTLGHIAFESTFPQWVTLRHQLGFPLHVVFGLDYEAGGFLWAPQPCPLHQSRRSRHPARWTGVAAGTAKQHRCSNVRGDRTTCTDHPGGKGRARGNLRSRCRGH